MVRTCLENHKAIGFLINTGPDPMENHKATKPAFNVVKWRTFHWWAKDGPAFSGI